MDYSNYIIQGGESIKHAIDQNYCTYQEHEQQQYLAGFEEIFPPPGHLRSQNDNVREIPNDEIRY